MMDVDCNSTGLVIEYRVSAASSDKECQPAPEFLHETAEGNGGGNLQHLYQKPVGRRSVATARYDRRSDPRWETCDIAHELPGLVSHVARPAHSDSYVPPYV